jgi:hypothetical protein
VSTAPGAGAPRPAAPTDRCPRCDGGFHCGVNDPTPCPCSTLSLPPALQAQLRQRYTGCLCVACLAALAAAHPAASPGSATGTGRPGA